MRWILVAIVALMSQLAVAAEYKIAVVDLEAALLRSEAADQSIKQFEKDNKADLDRLKTLREGVIKIRTRLEQEGDIIGEKDRQKLVEEIEEKSKDFQFYGGKLKQSEDKWKRAFFQQQLPEMEKLLKGIIDAGNYDVVVNSGAVIFAKPTIDLTQALTDKLDSRIAE